MSHNNEPLVIFHAQCLDGLGAALAAYLKFGERAEYRPIGYDAPPPDLAQFKDRQVFILDFSFPRPVIEEMISRKIDFVLLDHHKSAQEELNDLEGVCATYEIKINLDHSGAVLAFQNFHPGREIPELFRYIEDGDLWRWRLRDSVEINAALKAEERNLNNFKSIYTYWDQAKRGYVVAGRILLREQNEKVFRIADKAGEVFFEGYAVDAVNTQELQSEVGVFLAKALPPMGITWYWDGAIRRYKVSLRSEGDFDVSEIAKKFGGGGHKNAAGFFCEALPWKQKKARQPKQAAT